MVIRCSVAATAAVAFLLAGCASIDALSTRPIAPSSPFRQGLPARADAVRLEACLSWFTRVDAVVERDGVRDAQHSPIAGLPFLRTDRLLASFAGSAMLDQTEGLPNDSARYWVERLRQLDAESRRFELMNLSAAARADIVPRKGTDAHAEMLDCGNRLAKALVEDRKAFDDLRHSIHVSDDYSLVLRVAGLYPLTRWPFLYGVRRWRMQVQADFAAQPLVAPAGARLRRYASIVSVSKAVSVVDTQSAAAIVNPSTATLAANRSNPLQLPMPSPRDTAELLARHAPILDIEELSEADRPGLPVLRAHVGKGTTVDSSTPVHPAVDISRPVLTARTSLTRIGERTLLQLVYTVWFSERPRRQSLDLLAGRIDALTWRVTLDEQGRAWVYDSIHACGCYHLFFPTERARVRADAASNFAEEGLFAPLGHLGSLRGDAVVLRVAAGSHYLRRVSGVRRVDAAHDAVPLEIVSEDDLRSLPRADGTRSSYFGVDGLVAGSERAERWLFWPMGIRSAGAMRQAGRQATAFAGRRHFDDANLLERLFEPRPE